MPQSIGKPTSAHLGVRIDGDLSDAVDREIERETRGRPGFTLNRSDMARMSMAEAIAAREEDGGDSRIIRHDEGGPAGVREHSDRA